MVELRPLIVVTGTVHVEGGETNTVRNRSKTKTRAEGTVVLDRKVSPDRRDANVITTNYMRKLRMMAVLRTPFGVLLKVNQLDELRQLLSDVGGRIATYNVVPRKCSLSNCVLWERLRGTRLIATAGWIDAQLAGGNTDVKKALSALVVNGVDVDVAD